MTQPIHLHKPQGACLDAAFPGMSDGSAPGNDVRMLVDCRDAALLMTNRLEALYARLLAIVRAEGRSITLTSVEEIARADATTGGERPAVRPWPPSP